MEVEWENPAEQKIDRIIMVAKQLRGVIRSRGRSEPDIITLRGQATAKRFASGISQVEWTLAGNQQHEQIFVTDEILMASLLITEPRYNATGTLDRLALPVTSKIIGLTVFLRLTPESAAEVFLHTASQLGLGAKNTDSLLFKAATRLSQSEDNQKALSALKNALWKNQPGKQRQEPPTEADPVQLDRTGLLEGQLRNERERAARLQRQLDEERRITGNLWSQLDTAMNEIRKLKEGSQPPAERKTTPAKAILKAMGIPPDQWNALPADQQTEIIGVIRRAAARILTDTGDQEAHKTVNASLDRLDPSKKANSTPR